jgi:hypothetical protein
MYNQTPQTVSIGTLGDYVPMDITGVFDTSTASGMSSPTNGFGVKNDTGDTQLFVIIATADANIGNDRIVGIRLFKDDGINPIDILSETTCTASTGTNDIAKLMTQWMVELNDGESVGVAITSLSDNDDIIINSAKIIAFTSGRQNTSPYQPNDKIIKNWELFPMSSTTTTVTSYQERGQIIMDLGNLTKWNPTNCSLPVITVQYFGWITSGGGIGSADFDLFNLETGLSISGSEVSTFDTSEILASVVSSGPLNQSEFPINSNSRIVVRMKRNGGTTANLKSVLIQAEWTVL